MELGQLGRWSAGTLLASGLCWAVPAILLLVFGAYALLEAGPTPTRDMTGPGPVVLGLVGALGALTAFHDGAIAVVAIAFVHAERRRAAAR